MASTSPSGAPALPHLSQQATLAPTLKKGLRLRMKRNLSHLK